MEGAFFYKQFSTLTENHTLTNTDTHRRQSIFLSFYFHSFGERGWS